MPDYKEMYLHLARETEKAVRILIEAQRECEEMYISAPEENVVLLDTPPEGQGCLTSAPSPGPSGHPPPYGGRAF